MIKTIALDMGGVVVAIDIKKAQQHFREVGLKDVERFVNPFHQEGFFGDLEGGKITAEEFRMEFSRLVGREVTPEECSYACMGFIDGVSQPALDTILELRKAGYRVVLLSNTNPYVMTWAMSSAFDGRHPGHGLRWYFDACYLSYACQLTKPDPEIFRFVLDNELIRPDELLFVDDGARNVEVAQSLGIHTLLARTATSWPSDLPHLL
jgi:putative hydrolase of the HAD superfamily